MKWAFALLSAHALVGNINAVDLLLPVIPAVVYRDYFFVHYLNDSDPKDFKPYVIAIRPLNDSRIKVTVELRSHGWPRNNFESLFIRQRIFVISMGEYSKMQFAQQMVDDCRYISTDKLCDAKWVPVEPNGKPIVYKQGAEPAMWARTFEGAFGSGLYQGRTEIIHTAVAAVGERELFAFDLVHDASEAGKPIPPLKIIITRIIPEENARIDGWKNFGKPEEKPAGGISSLFTEPFQAYVLDDDFYFITKSGLVFVSPPTANGKPREMVAVWDKSKPQVRFIISDGNRTGVHFLVVAREKGGWNYFRLGRTPKPEVLDLGEPQKNDTPAELAYKLAKILRDKKEIVNPK